MAMVAETPSLRRSIEIVNQISSSKCTALSEKVLLSIQSQASPVLTPDESTKLQNSIKITADDLSQLINSLTEIFKQTVYSSMKPDVLTKYLTSLGMEEPKASILGNLWNEKGKAAIEAVRKGSIAPKQLETINWRLNLELASKAKAKQKNTNGLFELGIASDSPDQAKEKVLVEFTHDELYQFYHQLETIQSQLDSLT